MQVIEAGPFQRFGASVVGTKDGMQRYVDGHRFIDSIQAARVIVALFPLKSSVLGRSLKALIVLVEFWTEIPGCNRNVNGSHRVYIEIIVRNALPRGPRN